MTGPRPGRWVGPGRRAGLGRRARPGRRVGLRRRVGDDTGASLVFALVIVTVIAVTVAVVLSFTDTSLRASSAVNDQMADAASADGAAKIAINAIRQGTYHGGAGGCFPAGAGSSNTLDLPNFYPPPLGPADSATVTCTDDPAHAGSSAILIGPANKPGSAILTLGTLIGEDGLHVDVADGRTLNVHGGVFVNSSITVPRGGLAGDTAVTARGLCLGAITGSPLQCAILAAPDPAGTDPDYPPPSASQTPRSVPTCSADNQLVTFTPGLYTDITGLNLLTRCHNTILYFPPGTYYFNFADITPWRVDGGDFLVAGTPTTPLVAGTAPSIPGSCASPVPPNPPGGWTPPGPNAGVQFVFGGGARLELRSAQAEICGNYAASAPPVAVYGLKTAVGSVPAESGCTILGPYPVVGCAALKALNFADARLYVQGTTYLPRAAVDIALDNPVGRVFSVGVIARSVWLTPTTSASLADPVIEVPDDTPIGRRTVLYLVVYVCPASATCSAATGTVRLRSTIGVLDPTGTPVAGARQITVYSWSAQR